MKTNHHTEIKKCQCYNCGKETKRVYNFTLQKWARTFKCKCGSESFRWYNW
jgi:lysyl-tRNA synthetase class I